MKKTILFPLVLFAFQLSFSQTPKENLEKDFTTYITLTIEQDFEKSFDYIVDEFFDLFSKEEMIKASKEIFYNPYMELSLEQPEILEIGNIEKIDNRYYSILTYSNLMIMKIYPEDDDESKEDKEMRLGVTKTMFDREFGEQNVTLNERTDEFVVFVEQLVCAVSKNGNNGWKFIALSVSADEKEMLKQIVPEKILNQFE